MARAIKANEGILVSGPAAEAVVPYEDIGNIHENADFTLIYEDFCSKGREDAGQELAQAVENIANGHWDEQIVNGYDLSIIDMDA